MSRRRLRWDAPAAPPPAHPYRDTLLVYGVLAAALVVLAWATGSNVGRAVVVAVFVFAASTAWSLLRWRRRLARRDGTGGPGGSS